jgi:hypothetical protein
MKFYAQQHRGGHRASPRWVLHESRYGPGGVSFCGLANTNRYYGIAPEKLADRLQGQKVICQTCARLGKDRA